MHTSARQNRGAELVAARESGSKMAVPGSATQLTAQPTTHRPRDSRFHTGEERGFYVRNCRVHDQHDALPRAVYAPKSMPTLWM